MAFSIDTHNLPWIPNYEAAVKEFEKHTPIRGGDQSVRRIANRKDNTKLLIEEIRDGVRVYKARLWRTDLIVYYPTHYEISIGGWPTTSTFKFLNTVSPSQIYTDSDREYVPQDFDMDNRLGYHYYAGVPIASEGRFKFAYGTNKPLEPERHPVYKKYKLNRKALNAVYKDYRPFMAYAKTMLGLMTEEAIAELNVTREVYTQLIRFNTSINLLRGSQEDADLSTWFSLFQAIAYDNRRVKWSPRREWVCYESDIMRDLRKRIKSNNPQVLEVKEIIRAV